MGYQFSNTASRDARASGSGLGKGWCQLLGTGWIFVCLFLHVTLLQAQPETPNYVLSLGGTNSCLELPSGAFNDLEEVTIEGWVKWLGDTEKARFFDFGKDYRAVRVKRGDSP